MKKVIINADDFGMSRIFNDVILELLEKDLIKSTSVLVNREIEKQVDQLEELRELFRKKDISVGLHFESDPKEQDFNKLAENIEKQNEAFINYFRFNPTHIDKHKQVYSEEEAKVMVDFAIHNKIFIRNSSSGHIQKYKDDIKTINHTIFLLETDINNVKDELLNKIKEDEVVEIITHPGKFDPECKSSLNQDREKDYQKIINIVPFLKENNIEVINQKNI